jgi:hypothetical protein
MLTDAAEDGTSTPMLLARSLERYARPPVTGAVARHAADPAAACVEGVFLDNRGWRAP